MNEYILHSNYDNNCHKSDAKLHKYINCVQLFVFQMSFIFIFQPVRSINM